MCLRAQSIDNYNNGVCIVRQVLGLSNNDGGVGKGQKIDYASKKSEKTTEAAGARRRAQEIYDDDGGVSRGRYAQRLKQQQQRRRWRIENAFKGWETTAEAAADRQRTRWIGNNNDVLISLAIVLLIVTLSCINLVTVLFSYFSSDYFPPVHSK